MKYIRIFLASSIVEFEREREQLKRCISSLNDTYVHRGVFFELILCEYRSNAMSAGRKQDEYNKLICDSQFFYVLIGQNAGEYTIEEFDVALEHFHTSGTPKIYTYFRILPDGRQPGQSTLDFEERLKQLGHYFSRFEHPDSIMLNMLLEFVRDPELQSTVTFENGHAVVTVEDEHGDLRSKPLLSLENVPLYSKNEAVQRLLAERSRLNDEFVAFAAERGESSVGEPHNPEQKADEQRARIEEQLHQMEMDILGLYQQTSEKRQTGIRINWREKRALELLDAGNYEGAKSLLRDTRWDQEIRNAEETLDSLFDRLREYISGKRTLISALRTEGSNPESLKEVTSIYEELVRLAEKYRIELDVLYDYAYFLWTQRQYPQGIRIAERLKLHYELSDEIPQAARGALLNLLGVLHSGNDDFKRAEENYSASLVIFRELAQSNPAAYESNLANSCNNLANLLMRTDRAGQAEPLHREALGLYRHLVQSNPAVYESALAASCSNLAILLEGDRPEEAAELHREADVIRNRSEQPDLAAHETNQTDALRNSTVSRESRRRMAAAEGLHRAAREIRLRSARSDPAAHEPNQAEVLGNSTVSQESGRRTAAAAELLRRTEDIRRPDEYSNPAAHEADRADNLSNLSVSHEIESRTTAAERLHRTAPEFRRRREQKDAVVNAPITSARYRNLTDMLDTEEQKASA